MILVRWILLVMMCALFSIPAFAADYGKVDTVHAAALLNDSGAVFVDAREPDAFNGWALHGERRGGHLPKATNLAASWIVRTLPRTAEVTAAKHLERAASVVVYGDDEAQARVVADWLVAQGIPAERIALNVDSFALWAESDLPLERLAQYDRIVPASWLRHQMDEKAVMVVEASWGKGETYEKGHIPGAVHLNTDLLESEARKWNFLLPAELEKNLLSLGITADTPVVVYGEIGIDAARAAVAMLYMGVRDVRLLNGGLQAWAAAGNGVEQGRVTPLPAERFGVPVPQRPELVIGIPEARKMLTRDNAELVSIRSWDEYTGKTSGYSYIKPKGRIKGAVWGHGGTDANNMNDFRNPDDTMRDYTEIARFWADWGITPDKEIAFFCGTGWRASETLLYAMAMGYPDVRLFDDGWFIWSMDPANPTATGQPR